MNRNHMRVIVFVLLCRCYLHWFILKYYFGSGIEKYTSQGRGGIFSANLWSYAKLT